MDKNYYDVSYEHVNNNQSPKPAIYYTIGEVSKELGEESSTVRYWSNKYYDFLDVEMCNTHRRFSRLDIDKLKVIQQCKQKKMTHNQIINALKETNFDITVVENSINEINKHLDIQLLAAALSVEVNKRLDAMEERINEKINNKLDIQNDVIKKSLEDISEHICVTVDSMIEESLNEIEVKKEDLDKLTSEISKQTEMIQEMKSAYVSMEEIKKFTEKQNLVDRFKNWIFKNK